MVKEVKRVIGIGKASRISKVLSNLVIEQKILDQMSARLWTTTDIENVIKAPNRMVKTRDTRYKTDGTRRDDPATAFIQADGHYVVVNDLDYTVVQISNKSVSDWASPF